MRSIVALLVVLLAQGAQGQAQEPVQEQGHESPSLPDSPTAGAGVGASVAETQLDRDVRSVAAELRCPVCQGLSLADSPSELSQEMKDVIHAQLAEGKSPEEVKAYFVSKYGEWILMEPKAEGFNLAVYVLPVLALLGGGAFVFVTARRWVRVGEAADPTESESGTIQSGPSP